MDRKRLIEKEIRYRVKRQDKSNFASKSYANLSPESFSEFPIQVNSFSVDFENKCIYSDFECHRLIYEKDSRPCIDLRNLNGRNIRFCRNVPIERRASLVSSIKDSIKKGLFEVR